jgi:hypothetical protein
MKSELIELVFEAIRGSQLNDFVNDLLPASNVIEIASEGVLFEFKDDSVFDYFDTIKRTDSSPTSIFIKGAFLNLDGVIINEPLVQILSYDGMIDALFIFSLADVRTEKGIDPLETIRLSAIKIAEKIDPENFFCGLEPAQDRETRFFSKDTIGPLTSPWHQ